jgi:hypothetical protein
MEGGTMRKFMRRTTLVLATLAALSTQTGSAIADKPLSSTFVESGFGVFANCDGFDVIESATVRVRDTVYFDRDGHRIRHVVHILHEGTLVNSETGEEIAPDRAAFTLDERLTNPDATNEAARAGTFRVLGLNWHIKLDGKVVAIDAGQLRVDIHQHDDPFDDEVLLDVGRRDVESGEFDICAALA